MEIGDEVREKVKAFMERPKEHMGQVIGIEFTTFKKDEVAATMPVDRRTVQPFGILHGGASVALAETLASIGAWLQVDIEKEEAVGVEINANHVRPVPEGGEVRGVARPLHIGRKIQVWQTKIYNQDDKLVCVSRCTLAVVPRRK